MCFKAFVTVHTIKCMHHQDISSKTTRIKDKESKIVLYSVYIHLIDSSACFFEFGFGLARFTN